MKAQHNTTILKVASVLSIALSMVACSSSTNESSEVSTKTSDVTAPPANKVQDSKAKKVFSSIPEPIEATKLLKDAGAKYNAGYLNPIENASKYTSVKAKAMNLGVFGSDLSFISLYDQTQESMLYLKCTNTLASGLGITGAFDENTTTRIQASMDKKDSLLAIISGSYWTADKYLVGNGQPGVSSLIVAGGWVEGLYIATRIGVTTKNEAVITQIGAQKTSLVNLIELLETYKNENNGTVEVLTSLNDLKAVFDASTTDASGKLTEAQFKAISDKTGEIRNAFIKP